MSLMFLSYFAILATTTTSTTVSAASPQSTNNNLLTLFPLLEKKASINKNISAIPSMKGIINNNNSLLQNQDRITATANNIKNIVNATAIDFRNSIRKVINESRDALLSLGIRVTELASVAVVAIAIITFIRQPRLSLDKLNSPVIKKIDLPIYSIEDPHIPINLGTFYIGYKINSVHVHNRGWKAAKNCKGILDIGDGEKTSRKQQQQLKVYWSTTSDIDRITINPQSMECLDLFAILDGDPSEIYQSFRSNILKLRDYVNSDIFGSNISLREGLNSRINELTDKYKSSEDIPKIIIQTENEGWKIFAKEYRSRATTEQEEDGKSQFVMLFNKAQTSDIQKGMIKIVVRSENARRLQTHVPILG